MVTDASRLATRLKFARERAGLTQAQIGERAGFGGSSVSEFENGKREPSLSQLAAFASICRRPIAFFLEKGPIPRELVRWRQRPSEGAEDVEVQFLRLAEQYGNLEIWCDARAVLALPNVTKHDAPFSRADAEALALSIRRELALGDYPGTTLLRTLEELCGVKVFHLDFQPRGTAACTKGGAFGAAVLLNAKSPRWRRNFDLAHELFHLLTWDLFEPVAAKGSSWAADEERLADAFAANLLMPADAVKHAVAGRLRDGRLPLPALFEITRQFDVSAEALIWRIHNVYGGTTADKLRTEAMVVRAREAARFYEDREHDGPPARPARFVSLAIAALRNGEVSIGRFAEYVGTTRQGAMSYVEEGDGDGDAFELPSA